MPGGWPVNTGILYRGIRWEAREKTVKSMSRILFRLDLFFMIFMRISYGYLVRVEKRNYVRRNVLVSNKNHTITSAIWYEIHKLKLEFMLFLPFSLTGLFQSLLPEDSTAYLLQYIALTRLHEHNIASSFAKHVHKLDANVHLSFASAYKHLADVYADALKVKAIIFNFKNLNELWLYLSVTFFLKLVFLILLFHNWLIIFRIIFFYEMKCILAVYLTRNGILVFLNYIYIR